MKYVTINRSAKGDYFYTFHSPNHRKVGSNLGINRKRDCIKTLTALFPDWEIRDKTKKK